MAFLLCFEESNNDGLDGLSKIEKDLNRSNLNLLDNKIQKLGKFEHIDNLVLKFQNLFIISLDIVSLEYILI